MKKFLQRFFEKDTHANTFNLIQSAQTNFNEEQELHMVTLVTKYGW